MIDGGGASWRACLLLCAVAGGGCDYVFRIDHLPYPDDAGANADAGLIDSQDASLRLFDAASACASPVFYEPFTGDTPCMGWTNAYATDTGMTEAAGVLTIAPSQNVGSVGGCATPQNNYVFGSGVTAIVNRSLTGSGSYTVLSVYPVNLQIQVSGGMLRFQTTASQDIGNLVTYTTAMRWWRIRIAGTSVLGEYSTDGANWNTLGATTVTPPPGIGFEISAGSNNGGNVGSAIFDQLMICP